MPLAAFPIADALQIATGAGTVAGAAIGFAFPADDVRRLVENIVLGAGVGAVVLNMVAFVIALAAAAAGA